MRVDLPGDHWIDIKDELSTGDLERIAREAQVWDAESRQWQQSGYAAAIRACDWMIVEWAVPGGEPPSAEAARKLPAKLGLAIINALNSHVAEQGISPEDLGNAS